MESERDTRFDPNLAVQLLLDVAREHSLEQLLERLVTNSLKRPDLAFAQVWLLEPGDLCAVCPCRADCHDQSCCLHLVAGNGISICEAGQARPRFGDPNARVPLGLGEVGKAVATRQQTYVRDLDKEPGQMPGFDWLTEERVLGCRITPIIFKGDLLGVLIGFTRRDFPEESRPWGRVIADHIAAAIANARAFEEIQHLKAQLEQRNAYLEEEVEEAKAFGDLVGRSAALRQILSQVELVAPTEASVLISGETGTGKELVAHEIHRRSRRKDGPLVRVNCASIPRELFESEFFGHVKGAFTGAIKDRAGRFESAEGGTIFLDEIGEVPLEMQSKLLRVIQEKLYERVGDDRTRSADVRIIAATNRDLNQAVAAGRFREDLYYRLHVFPIEVPPLRERKDDIPVLAEHFLKLSVRELKCAKPRLTHANMLRLQAYDWPGNVRELRNVLERAVILARGGTLEFSLPVAGPPGPAARAASRPETHPAATPEPEFLTETELQQRERDNLLVILNKAHWKIKGPDGAAELLGVKPPTLLSRMNRWGLKRPELQ